MGKGENTRHAVLSHALDLASELGLEGISFGVLAKLSGMSKSGLYAHFDSKEQLQCEVLDTAASRFIDVVMSPALKQPRGLPRMQVLFEMWLRWENEELPGGCIFVSAATEFDAREGSVRDHLIAHFKDLLGAIARTARITVEEGHFRADVDVDQFAYEVWSILVAHQHYQRLLEDDLAHQRARQAFANLVERYRVQS